MNILYRVSLISKFISDRNIPFKDKWMTFFLLLYLFSPIDLIPEPVLGFGFIDDIVVLVYLLSAIYHKAKKYYDFNTSYDERKMYENDRNNVNRANKDTIIEDVEYEMKDDEDK